MLVTGRMDVSGPPDIAWQLHQAWPGSELVIEEVGGHGTGQGDVLDDAFTRAARTLGVADRSVPGDISHRR